MRFRLPIYSVHYDAAGIEVENAQPYLLEWLRRNYLPNGSFENWTDTDLDDWTITVTGASSVTQVGDPYNLFGTYAVQMLSGSGLVYAQIETTNKFRVNPHYSYNLSGYTRFYTTSLIETILCTMKFYTVDNVYISSKSKSLVVDGTTYLKTSATFLSSDIPTNAYYATLALKTTTSTTCYFIDGLVLTRHATVIPDWDDFDYLYNDDEETFTFPDAAPLVGTELASGDDPTEYLEMENGDIQMETSRDARRGWLIKTRLYSREALQQLRRFHAKVRNKSFYYDDADGIAHEVIWRGGFAPPAVNPADVYIVSIPLIPKTITIGE
jgi:hypothetical protein